HTFSPCFPIRLSNAPLTLSEEALTLTPGSSMTIRIGVFSVTGTGESPQAEISTTGALALAARIRSFNANVPDGFFIAPAGLTPGILIDKHKVKVAAQHSSRIGRLEVDRMRPA